MAALRSLDPRVGVGETEEVIGCSLCGDRRVQPLVSPRHPEGARLGDLYSGGYGKFLTGHYAKRRLRRSSARNQRRIRRAVNRGSRGDMMRALAFADPEGPRRWGFADDAIALQEPGF